MATLIEVAEQIRRWATANKMMGEWAAAPEPDMGVIRQALGVVGVPQATKVLQNRQIAYIWIDDEDNKIIICTERKLTTKEESQLASAVYHDAGGADYVLEFVHGSIAHVGGNPLPPKVPPYHLHNDRYTCGSSIYIASEKGAGTMGCLVENAAGICFGLSNNHVSGGCNYAAKKLPILAPGLADVGPGGKDPETIGHHASAYPFVDGQPEIVNATGNIDAALFEIADMNRVSSKQQGFHDTPASTMPLAVGMEVEKVGRTTGRTKGQVIARSFGFEPVLYDLDIIRGRKIVYFPNIYIITGTAATGNFSEPGDSGSLVTHVAPDGIRYAVGLLFAGNGAGLTFVVPIGTILNYFGVTLKANHNL